MIKSRLKRITAGIVILNVCLFFSAYSQETWTKVYSGKGNESISKILPTQNGYICVGYTTLFETNDHVGWIVNFNESGDTLWTKVIDTDLDVVFSNIIYCSDNQYIILGKKNPFFIDGKYIWLLKINSSGDTLKTKVIGENKSASSIIQINNSEYLIAGITGESCYLARINSDLDVIWEKSFKNLRPIKIMKNSGEEFQIIGVNNYRNIGLLKIDASGDSLDYRTSELKPLSILADVIKTHDGGYVFAVDQYSGFPWIIKTASNGYQNWNNQIYNPELKPYLIQSIIETNDNGFITVGQIEEQDLFITKLNKNGDYLWSKRYKRDFKITNRSTANSIIQTANKGYFIPAEAYYPGYNQHLWLVRTDSLGNVYYNVNTEVKGQGKIEISDEPYIYGSEVKVTAIPDDGWRFKTWSGDLSNSSSLTSSFVVDTNKSVTAEFEQIPQNYINSVSGTISIKATPNPFSTVTEITFNIYKPGLTSLKVYDMLGNEVAELLNEFKTPGKYSLMFNRYKLTNGIYFCKLKSGKEKDQIFKLILEK